MINYTKIMLWSASFERRLFKKELYKIAELCDSIEFLRLKKYCYEKYYDMFPDIVDEVFLNPAYSNLLITAKQKYAGAELN